MDKVEAEPVAALVAPVLVELVVDVEGDGEAHGTEPVKDGADQVESTLEWFE